MMKMMIVLMNIVLKMMNKNREEDEERENKLNVVCSR